MKKKLNAICVSIVCFAVAFTVFGVRANQEYDIQTAKLDTCAASAGTTSLEGFISEKVDGFGDGTGDIVGDVSDIAGSLGGFGGDFFGGIGDSLGGLGDSLSGILGGLGNNSTEAPKTTEPNTYAVEKDTIGYITPVPYASESETEKEEETEKRVNETVDFSATQNPFKKPTGELKGGDKGDGVRWMQWVFIYTRYGLKDDGITGVFDEDTVAVVKKLQKEKGLEVDGVVDGEVIAQIELLYFEAVYGATSTTLPNVSATESTVPAYNAPATGDETGALEDGGLILTIALALVWIVAIGLIVVLFLLKKKKKKKAKSEEKTVNESDSSESIGQTEASKESSDSGTEV